MRSCEFGVLVGRLTRLEALSDRLRNRSVSSRVSFKFGMKSAANCAGGRAKEIVGWIRGEGRGWDGADRLDVTPAHPLLRLVGEGGGIDKRFLEYGAHVLSQGEAWGGGAAMGEGKGGRKAC